MAFQVFTNKGEANGPAGLIWSGLDLHEAQAAAAGHALRVKGATAWVVLPVCSYQLAGFKFESIHEGHDHAVERSRQVVAASIRSGASDPRK